ncbi:MAG: hypothetical protein ACP5UI_00535 [Thermoprotei archaeon]|nr:hypothetical protein [TACK group archaeon]
MKDYLKASKLYDQLILEFLLGRGNKVYTSEKELVDYIDEQTGSVDRSGLNRALMRMEIRGLIRVTAKDSSKIISLAE